jgi:ketosteroid isomerase-like protein
MKSNRRKLVRRSFMAVVTGTSALALQACSSDNEQDSAGNNSAQEERSGSESGGTDSDGG